MSRSSHSFLVGLVGTGIGPSLTPALHEREADELGIRYLYRRLDLDELRLQPGSIGDLLAAARSATTPTGPASPAPSTGVCRAPPWTTSS